MTQLTAIQPLSRKDKLSQLMAEMNVGLLERKEQIKLILLAALAGEHVLLVGPPGTAKSELAKRLKNIFVEASYFERLLTRFSVPEEVFGPLSIRALEDDRYVRLTSGYLPDASVAFIDEIFKANSAILNSLLTILNEREFDNGNRRYKVPLISVIAASNELPEGEELSALYDRFMLRSFVGQLSDSSFSELLQLSAEKFEPELNIRLKLEDLTEVQQLADKVTLSSSVLALCKEFRAYLNRENIYVSDRRWLKLIKLMKVSAFTSGLTQVSNYDAWVLPHCLWNKPVEFSGLQDLYNQAVAINGDFTDERASSLVTTWEGRLKADKSQQKQKVDNKGRPLFINDKGKQTLQSSGEVQKTNAKGEVLYWDDYDNKETTSSRGRYSSSLNAIMINQAFKPVMESISYSEDHIKGRVAGVEEILAKIKNHINALSKQREDAKTVFESHIWLNPELLSKVIASLDNALEYSHKLSNRLVKVKQGFEALPREQDVDLSDTSISVDAVLEGELCE